jgi:hypothetical protein
MGVNACAGGEGLYEAVCLQQVGEAALVDVVTLEKEVVHVSQAAPLERRRHVTRTPAHTASVMSRRGCGWRGAVAGAGEVRWRRGAAYR